MNKKKVITNWLRICLIAVLIQTLLGGITRITGSGLSITEWEIATGVVPPLNQSSWEVEFDKYKDTPQYKKINQNMDLKGFKFIYFWEWFHRFWGRLLGMLFILPLIFIRVEKNDKWLINRQIIGFIFVCIVGLFGWIMVKSGLKERPWVSAYNLTLHFSLALLTITYLFWTFLKWTKIEFQHKFFFSSWFSIVMLGLIGVQIIFGGFIAGMRAALIHPNWPKISGEWIPGVLGEQVNVAKILMYESSLVVPTWIHFVHRNLPTIIVLFTMISLVILRKNLSAVKKPIIIFIGILLSQIVLGILTLVNSQGAIPLFYGVLHQLVAILLFLSVVNLKFLTAGKN